MKNPKQRGQATVEMALVFPIFAVMLLGMIDAGRLMTAKHMLDVATREGVRAGTIHINPETARRTAEQVCINMLNDLDQMGLRLGEQAEVRASVEEIEGVEAVVVRADYVFVSLFNAGQFRVVPAITLNSTSRMRKEG